MPTFSKHIINTPSMLKKARVDFNAEIAAIKSRPIGIIAENGVFGYEYGWNGKAYYLLAGFYRQPIAGLTDATFEEVKAAYDALCFKYGNSTCRWDVLKTIPKVLKQAKKELLNYNQNNLFWFIEERI